LALAGADGLGCVAARELAAVEHRFQNSSRFRWKISESNLFLAPHRDAGAQAIRLNEIFHEFNLVDAQFQKEPCESGKSFFTQIAAPIEIISAGLIAIGEMIFVLYYIAGETPCDRPYSACIESLEKRRVENQSCDAPVAIEKWVYPQQAVMRRGS
jgi:hypothetical protein